MKLTKIAIALAAVLAMSAVAASSASAANVELKSTGFTDATLQGIDTVNHKFTVEGQNVTCNESKFNTGKITVPAKNITAKAEYSGCTAFGFAGAKVEMGNCHYIITEPVELNANEFTSEVDVECPTEVSANNVINVNASVFGSECSVSIAAHTNTGHIIIKNTANDIDLNITVNNITATKNKDNGLCPLSGTGVVNTASYNGELTVSDVNGHAIEVKTNP